jgi:hypothetical protein
MTRQDGVGRVEPDARVVKGGPIAALRREDAVVVAMMGLCRLGGGERGDALAAGVGLAATMRIRFVAVDELAVERADLVPNEDQVSGARQLPSEDDGRDDRG